MRKSKLYVDRMIENGRDYAVRKLRDIRAGQGQYSLEGMTKNAASLLTARGQASGVKVASDIIKAYPHCKAADKKAFFHFLLSEFGRDKSKLIEACLQYGEQPDHKNLKTLTQIIEPRRQELIRRINMAPGGTWALVQMRKDLQRFVKEDPSLKPVDIDFLHLFKSWFNRGFLTMQDISWSSPALILERLIAYESVHEITSWQDLKSRLDPPDRRCYAFFHPSLTNEPLIFVEVALCADIPVSIQDILSPDREVLKAGQEKVAAFYSINNCLTGLRGISFGNFLIKQVVENLRADYPKLNKFVTLSPIPGFSDWLIGENRAASFKIENSELLRLQTPDWFKDASFAERMKPALRRAALSYLLDRQPGSHRLHNSVARFHLGNGARIEDIQWLADTSARGLSASFGMMVNYLYKLDQIENNHEAFAVRHEVIISKEMKNLHKKNPKLVIVDAA